MHPARKTLIAVALFLILQACTRHGSNDVNDKASNRDAQSKLIDKLIPFDVPMGKPKGVEWLAFHDEKGQPYAKYVTRNPVKAIPPRTIIYLRPIGKFSPSEKLIIQYTTEYLSIFFGLETVVLKDITDKIVPFESRRGYGTSEEQLQTYPILNYLEKTLPSDAAVVMGITNKDLYPNDNYNFVFGQARTKTRVGVSSFVRYYEGKLDSANQKLCLERLIKTSAHEIGHMFTIQHCTHAVCVMNGSNGLAESDSRPNRLCSDCLRKLQWNIGFEILPRAKQLQTFFEKHHAMEDYQIMSRDIGVLESVQ